MSYFDEIIAANVRRIREDEKKWSVSTLASELGLPKHVVYDMERPRKGQKQRSFSWIDLVALCKALETNLYELVLPPEGRLREDLGWRLFGVGGNSLAGPVLERFDQYLEQYLDRRESEIVTRIAEAVGVNPEEVTPVINPATRRPGQWSVPIDLVGRLEGSGDQTEEE